MTKSHHVICQTWWWFLLCAEIQPNAPSAITIQTAKAAEGLFRVKRWNLLHRSSLAWRSRLQAARRHNERELMVAAPKAGESIEEEDTERTLMSVGRRLRAVIEYKPHSAKYLIPAFLFDFVSGCPITFEPLDFGHSVLKGLYIPHILM